MSRPRSPRTRPLVLMYHAFGSRSVEQDPHLLFVRLEDFERQVRLLRRVVIPIDLSAYIKGWTTERWPARRCLITMDDGYASVLEAAEVLARQRLPAVVFVCPGRLGDTSSWMPQMPHERLLSAEEVRELDRFGIQIGVHGMDHSVVAGLPENELRRHVVEARDALADITGRLPRAFAYPEGLFDERALHAVKEAGYEVAFSIHQDGGRFGVTRRPVTPRDSLLTFAGKLLPGYERLERMSAGRKRIRRTAAALLGQRPLGSKTGRS